MLICTMREERRGSEVKMGWPCDLAVAESFFRVLHYCSVGAITGFTMAVRRTSFFIVTD